ncbi:membrane protein [Bartonella quintana]|nr:membrane protein [Bartonella quintana]
MLNSFHHFGQFTIGEWSAYPQAGTANTDPYTRARTAKRGDISIGRTEGLIFQIWKDNHGRPLHSNCHYLLKGHIPEARLFTLYTADKFLKPYTSPKEIPFELYTNNVIYESDGSLHVNISPTPQSGNWLATVSQKEFGLILTLYDTPIISATALHKLMMPSVEQVSSKQINCD